MRALFRTAACVAVLTPFALLVAGQAFGVTITGAGTPGSATSGAGTTFRNVATANDPPYCSGTYFVISGSGFVYDSPNPNPVKGAVIGVSIGNVPAAWYEVGSDITLYAQVGPDATTGPIIVTTPAGTFSTDSLPGGRINAADTSAQGQLPGIQVVPCAGKPTIVKATVTTIKPNPTKGGRKVTINGSGFLGTTGVTVGGKAAQFAVVQDQNLVVIVPKSAKNGSLAVVITNPAGSVTSTVKLIKKS
jgi:hypothetical protein